MRFEKFTNRLQQALSDAQSLAMGKDHTAIAGKIDESKYKYSRYLIKCSRKCT
ncbi:hypothetical protein [Streptococcus agalactiae]|uniref:hypothetical protein n=1 Tax=Streptococcus agalactiae TaxID=1311 RepID=UPI0015DB9FF8